jgi:hypothetical protein
MLRIWGRKLLKEKKEKEMMRLWTKKVLRQEKEKKEKIKALKKQKLQLLEKRKALMKQKKELLESIAATAAATEAATTVATEAATAAATAETAETTEPPPGIGDFFEDYDRRHVERVRLWLQGSPDAPDLYPVGRDEDVAEIEWHRELRDRTTEMTRLGHRGVGG